jgi:hypothetical protein
MSASIAMRDVELNVMSVTQSLRAMKHYEGLSGGTRLTAIETFCPATPNIRFNLSGFNSPKLASAWLGRSLGGWRADSSTRSITYRC